jgi:hypothetical protein
MSATDYRQLFASKTELVHELNSFFADFKLSLGTENIVPVRFCFVLFLTLVWLPMRNTISRFTSSIRLLFSSDTSPTDLENRHENIKDAMLLALSKANAESNAGFDLIWSSVVRANNIEALWYLRCGVHSVLAKGIGEKAASKQLANITSMFNGLVSDSQLSVPKQARHFLAKTPRTFSREGFW